MPSEIQLDSRFEKDPNMVFRKIENECLLVQRIWELLDGKRAVMDIRDIIVDEFEVDPEEAQKDIVEFFQQLQEIGGVKVA